MRSSAVVLVLALVACRDPNANGGDDAPAIDGGSGEIDAPPGVGCDARSPRSVEVQAFVGPSGLQSRLTGLIDGAQDTLDIAMYLFNENAIASRIIAAKQRGVDVRVLFDPDHEGNAGVRSDFQAAGVTHRNAPSLYNFSHAKYMVIDGATAVIMSNNFNEDAMDRERNYGIVDRDPLDVADAAAVFAQDWAMAGGEPMQPADLTCTRLIVSPTNSKQRLVELIGSAQTSLEVEVMYISEDSVRDAIGAAKQRGVRVRVILDNTADNTDSIAYLRGLGIEVHSNFSFRNHAKLIIADGVAFVGSVNISQSAMTRNREMGALVFEPTPAGVIKQQFESDWSASSN